MNTKIKTGIGLIIIFILVTTIGVFVWQTRKKIENPNQPKGQQCTMETKVCPDGTTVSRTGPNCEFAPCPEIVGIEGKIIITSPKPNDTISNPVTVTGKARDTWFYEGNTPALVFDSNDKLLGSYHFVPVSKVDTSMKTEFFSFEGVILFKKPETTDGYILFRKDNPSGLPQNEGSYKLPVKFSGAYADMDISNWQVHINSKYGFEFRYPKYDFINGEPGVESSDDLTDTCVYRNGLCVTNFNIVRENVDKYGMDPEIKTLSSLKIEKIAQIIWEKNKIIELPNCENRQVSDIFKINVAGREAYGFDVTKCFDDYSGGWALDEEERVLFVANENNKFQIRFEKNNEINNQILSTFKFID